VAVEHHYTCHILCSAAVFKPCPLACTVLFEELDIARGKVQLYVWLRALELGFILANVYSFVWFAVWRIEKDLNASVSLLTPLFKFLLNSQGGQSRTMASPIKKARTEAEESVVGFIHGLSPVKISKRNTRYFDGTFQTGREEYHRVVVFGAEKHTVFEQAAVAKTPVKLSKVKKSISKYTLLRLWCQVDILIR